MSDREQPAPVESARNSDVERAHDEGREIFYQRREWRAQRVGWALMTVVVLAAALGLLGSSGPFASTQARATDGSIDVVYERLARHHAPSKLTIDVAPEFIEEGEIRLWVDALYMQAIGVESILPEPESVELEAGRMVYIFAVADPTSPLTITFYYEHDGFWSQRGQLGLLNGATVALRQFVFP